MDVATPELVSLVILIIVTNILSQIKYFICYSIIFDTRAARLSNR